MNFASTAPPEPDVHVADLLSLPTKLPSYRVGRYTGDNERVQLSSFAREDQLLLQQIYGLLVRLFLELKPKYTDRRASAEILADFLKAGHLDELNEWGSKLGVATTAQAGGDALAFVLHDLRGGAFLALLLRLQLLAELPHKKESVPAIFFRLRDHLKIMRNCVGNLDPERFSVDSLRQDHDAQLLVEKWTQAEFHAVRKPVEVHLHCHYKGTLCESCLEFSTLDRIIYNLMSNAAAHTSDGIVDFYVLPVPLVAPDNVRFIVTNSVSPLHRDKLDKAFGAGSLGEIFRGGFTTGGHGMGMRICADFCSQAYGISDVETAKNLGYFGAQWAGSSFVSWFHWPVASNCGSLS